MRQYYNSLFDVLMWMDFSSTLHDNMFSADYDGTYNAIDMRREDGRKPERQCCLLTRTQCQAVYCLIAILDARGAWEGLPSGWPSIWVTHWLYGRINVVLLLPLWISSADMRPLCRDQRWTTTSDCFQAHAIDVHHALRAWKQGRSFWRLTPIVLCGT